MNFNIGDFIFIDCGWSLKRRGAYPSKQACYGIVIGYGKKRLSTKYYRIRQLNGGSGLYPIEMIKLIAKAKQ